MAWYTLSIQNYTTYKDDFCDFEYGSAHTMNLRVLVGVSSFKGQKFVRLLVAWRNAVLALEGDSVVKNPMQETQVPSLMQEDPPRGRATWPMCTAIEPVL